MRILTDSESTVFGEIQARTVQALLLWRHTVVEAEKVRHLAHSAKEGDASAAAEDKPAEAVGRFVVAMDSMFVAVDSTVGAVQRFAAVDDATEVDTTEAAAIEADA